MKDIPIRRPTFLRNWRKYRHLTQEAAAERLGIAQGTLQRIEVGKIPYNQDFLEKCSLAYGVEIADLLETDPLRPDPPRLVMTRLRRAPKDMQDRITVVIEAMLKAG